MPSELDYYVAEMKAGRLRILLGPTTPQTWSVDYLIDREGGYFLKRWYDEYTGEPYEQEIDEDEVRNLIRLLGGGRIWGAAVERAAREQSGEKEPG